MICLPTEKDLQEITEHCKSGYWSIGEKPSKTKIENKLLNFEYAFLSGNSINLSKKELN
jgi:hypothetical protein